MESVAEALAAQCGGAQRIELCADLAVGGLTPNADLTRAVRGQIHLPIFAMIRPRGGDFVYSDAEFELMRGSVATAKELGMDGLVLGLLTRERRVDVERTRELVELARPLPVTFHRAFDESVDLAAALEDVIASGAARILTSGGAPTAPEGVATLAKLVAAAGNRIIILPGSGINATNIAQVMQTRAREFHSGLSSALGRPTTDHDAFTENVRQLADDLSKNSST